MMVVPQVLPEVAPSAIATYDAVDLQSGTGYKNFFGTDAIAGAASKVYNLTSNIVYAEDGSTSVAGAAFDLDFDLDFTKHITMEGVASFNIWFGAGTVSPEVQINFKKVAVGGGETQIGTEVSKTLSMSNSSDLFSGKYTMPLTNFIPGEKLRIIFSSASTTMTMYHDPKDRDATTLPGVGIAAQASTIMLFVLPFKVDL